MKKLLFYIITLSSFQMQAASPQLDKLALAITSAHTRAFSKDNLITERLMPEDSAKWNEAVKAVGEYIAAHASELKETFAQLNAINSALINTLQSTFGAYISPNLKTAKKKTGGGLKKDIFENIKGINFDKASKNLNTLKKDEDLTKKIQSDLDKSGSKIDKMKSLLGSSNQEAKNLLKHLALTLETTIVKALIDFNKLKQLALE